MLEFKRERKLKVLKKRKITSHFMRITFHSESLFDFSDKEVGGYIKLLFPEKGEFKNKNNLVRPFTIRNFRKEKLEIDIDFVVHEKNNGIASNWAINAKKGDNIKISGPGPREEVSKDSDWYFFVGDMSAIPAISVILENLDKASKGIAIIEIYSELDKIKLIKPNNIIIHWVINENPLQKCSKLFNKVSAAKWHKGNPYIWVACEFSKMKSLRNFFYNKKKIRKENMYASSYWKIGRNQEQHKLIKKQDSLIWKKN